VRKRQRQTDRKTERQKDRKTERQKDRKIKKKNRFLSEIVIKREKERERGRFSWKSISRKWNIKSLTSWDAKINGLAEKMGK
jgi:hypothetical protein